jgi:lipoate synthase
LQRTSSALKKAEEMGFKSVASGPFVRSSFHASEMFEVSPS